MSEKIKTRKGMIQKVKERLNLDSDLAANALWSDLIDNADMFREFKHGEDDPKEVLKALEGWMYTMRWTLEEHRDEITGKPDCNQTREQLEEFPNDNSGSDTSGQPDYDTYNGVYAGLSLLTEILEDLRHGEENAFTKKLMTKPPNRPRDVRAIAHLKKDVGKGYRFLMMCGATQAEAVEALNDTLSDSGLPIMTVDAIRKLAPKTENLHGNVGVIERFGFEPRSEENTGVWELPLIGHERKARIMFIASASLMLSIPKAKNYYGN